MLADQRRIPTDLPDPHITFTPLSGGRFRCNWSGEVVGRNGVRAARNRRWADLHPFSGRSRSRSGGSSVVSAQTTTPTATIQPKLPEAYINPDGSVQCPNKDRYTGKECKAVKYVSDSDTYTCSRCFKKFAAVKADLPEVRRTMDGHRCPYAGCGRRQGMLEPGVHKCVNGNCNRSFVVAAGRTASPPVALKRAPVLNDHGDANCPHCGEASYDALKFGEAEAEIQCGWCMKKFVVYRAASASA